MSAPTSGSGPAAGAGGTAVEFRCGSCNKLLRATIDSVGRRVKCPECAAIMQVPAPAAGASTDGPTPQHPTPAPFRPAGAGVPPSRATPPASERPAWSPSGTIPPTDGTPAPPVVAASIAAPEGGDNRRWAGSAPEGTSDSGSPFRAPSATAARIKDLFERISAEIRKIYIGQDELVLGTLVALFSGGHVLIESVPGLGKTLFVRTLGRVLGCRFGRIQFTADLMPSDITGAPIFDLKTQEFTFRPGPVFTQFLLADEINRSPAKTHAALLEIMQEYRVTVDRVSHKIERPFLVLATQNPIESEGTYNLPEAQLDRFMFKIVADYPAVDEEATILKMHSRQVDLDLRLESELQTITGPAEIIEITRHCGEVYVDDRLIDYVNAVVRLTRQWPQFYMGASPRAGLALVQGARTLAAFRGRDYAVPDDVVEIALPALRHRVMLTAEAEVEGQRAEDLLGGLIRSVEVPRI